MIMDILNFVFQGPAHFFGTAILLGTIASFRIFTINVNKTEDDYE